MPTTPFGQALRRMRREANLTLLDLTNVLDTTVSYLSAIERGQKNPLPPESIQKLLRRMDRLESFDEMVHLANKSRRSIQFRTEGNSEEVNSMLAALARMSDEHQIDSSLALQILDVLKMNRLNEDMK